MIFNILIYFCFEYKLKYFGVDFYTKGDISDITADSYSKIVFMFNLNYIIIIILFFMHQILSYRTNNRLKFELRKFRNQLDSIKDENSNHIKKIKSFTEELDNNNSNKLKWLDVLINKSLFYFEIKFDINNSNYLIENSGGKVTEDLDMFTSELLIYITDKNITFLNENFKNYNIDYIPIEKDGKIDKAYVFANKIN